MLDVQNPPFHLTPKMSLGYRTSLPQKSKSTIFLRLPCQTILQRLMNLHLDHLHKLQNQISETTLNLETKEHKIMSNFDPKMKCLD